MFFTSVKSFGFLCSLTRQHFHKAAIQNTRSFCIMAQLLDKIPDVDIDANGVFKYVLIMVHDDVNKQSKPIVRGYSRASWHSDIYDETGAQLKQYGSALDTECLGGGRINHNQPEKKILVYGYSQGFGKADHKVTVDLLKKKYPEYDITWSDEGY